ncbi:ROK family transcriptional regulator [Burkholderia gladioli]|uniref:ROK family transcriptional regulator n=1 Tax=Burkholderia gladioli TaxID=28095 RepID=UPI000CFF453E|nr:ROK family transcriptional regulator [Burkholderia gladioli]PRG99772.1 sugar kinase [Burkholderia gladioli]
MNPHSRKAPPPSAPVTRGPAFVRQGNEWAIYQHLLALAPATAPQLAQSTGLSKVTVTGALGNLERLGLVEQVGVREGSAGRQPRLYQPRARAGYVVAIDVGAAWIRGALADLSGNILARLEKRSPARASLLVARIVEMAQALAEAQALPREAVLATVLGSPGVFDPSSGRLRLAPNLPDWERADLVSSLRAALGEDTLFDNDINLAALGEQAHGIGRGVDNFVFMSIGTGIGLGIVTDGKLYRGAHGFAGEIAVLRPAPTAQEPGQDRKRQRGKNRDEKTSDDDGPRAAIFEESAAAKGIVAHARRIGLEVDDAEAVFAAALQGDERARACLAEQARQLAWGLAAIIPVLDPALVVLGGGIGLAGAALLPAIREQVAAWLPIPAPEFAISATGTDAVLLGAIVQGVERARLKAFERAG